MATHTLDFERPLLELERQIEEMKRVAGETAVDVSKELAPLEKKLAELRTEIYKNLTPMQRVQVARHPKRPYTLDYLSTVFTDFVELHGDRLFRDDPAMVAGWARLDGTSVMVIGHQKGRDTKENLRRNFGMAHPEGYRKALRLMHLAEQFREVHEAQRLAVALRMGHPEIAPQVLLGVAPLLMADHHDARAVQPRPPGHHRRVVAEQPVAVQLHEVGEYGAEIVERVGPLRVARHLHALHRRQVLVDLGPQLGELFLERGELLRDVHGGLASHALHLPDLALQLEQRPLEVQGVRRHHVLRTR